MSVITAATKKLRWMASSFVWILVWAPLLRSAIASPSDFFSFSGGSNMRQPNDNSDDGLYYKVLGQGMNRQSNVDEIKKAYRKKAMLLHPDKGGDAEDFKSLTEAYEVGTLYSIR